MAMYNPGFPAGYQPYNLYQQPYYPQPYQQPQSAPVIGTQMSSANQPPQTVQPPIQNGGFISVPNENEARNYPVAPGNSITFKDENLPYVYTKTMGFSQLDRPIFEKYRLVKEPEPTQSEQNAQTAPTSVPTSPEGNNIVYAAQRDVDALRVVVDEIKNDIAEFRDRLSTEKRSATEKEDADHA